MGETTDRETDLKKNALGTAPVGRLAISLAFPAIVAQACNALYTIIDRLFLARIPQVGDLAMTGVGVCFPILLAVSSFAALVGNGGAPLASIELGRGDIRKAERILGSSVAALIAISIVLPVLLQVFKEPILFAFGASHDTIAYAMRFLSVYLSGTVFVQLALGLNTFIAAQGKARVAMVSTLIGALLSVLLDPLFIFTFNMGVCGAALANVVAQAVSALWVVAFLSSKRSIIRLRLRDVRFNRLLGPVLMLGVSPFIMQLTECVIQVVFNSSLQRYGGDAYVGAMTIITSLMQLVWVFSNGANQGVQPIIGYNYGARRFDRVRRAYRGTLFTLIIVNSVMVLTYAMFPVTFAGLFTSDQDITEVVVRMLPLFSCGMGVFGVQSATQCAFVGMGQAKPSLFLAVLRKIILLVPLALMLPHVAGLGATGVFLAEPISDVISAITAGILFHRLSPRLLGA